MGKSMTTVGVVKALYYYPVKSMRGLAIAEARVGWHGLEGDRRYAFVRTGNASDFPWLTARQVPALVRYAPYVVDQADPAASTVCVVTPDGADLLVRSDALRRELAVHYGAPAHLEESARGVFDCASVSLIGAATIDALGVANGSPLDPRRFRPNILVAASSAEPFVEEEWLGSALVFGDRDDAVHIRLDERDPRCMMINLDPDTAAQRPTVLKTVVRAYDGCVGLYGAPERRGTIRVGDVIRLRAP